MVPRAGLEPARPKPLPPQDSVSTNSTTWAYSRNLNSSKLFCVRASKPTRYAGSSKHPVSAAFRTSMYIVAPGVLPHATLVHPVRRLPIPPPGHIWGTSVTAQSFLQERHQLLEFQRLVHPRQEYHWHPVLVHLQCYQHPKRNWLWRLTVFSR